MDFFKTRFLCLRICRCFCLIEQIHLFITFAILFTGRTELFPPGQCQAVGEHGVHEFQFLLFILQELDFRVLFCTLFLHDLHDLDQVFTAHVIQLFFCKKRFHPFSPGCHVI